MLLIIVSVTYRMESVKENSTNCGAISAIISFIKAQIKCSAIHKVSRDQEL